MCDSEYSIFVSKENKETGCRDVSLKHKGSPCFSVTHRGVQLAFIVRFRAEVSKNVALSNSNGQNEASVCSAYMQRSSPSPLTTEDLPLYSARKSNLILDGDHSKVFGGTPITPNVRSKDFSSPNETRVSDINEARETNYSEKVYLTIFHREELKDSQGRYTISQPLTLCSSYLAASAVHSKFALWNIYPSYIIPGSVGIFVHGKRQSSRSPPSLPLELDGAMYQAAADVWWMASPLVVKPVYVPMAIQKGSQGDGRFSRQLHTSIPSTSAVAARFSVIDATVIGQFRVQSNFFVIAQISQCEIRIAKTKIYDHLDLMTWVWWPQILSLPYLTITKSALSLCVSSHPSLSQQILFLHDKGQSVVYVIRTPDLYTGKGELILLFTIPDAPIPPLSFPSVSCNIAQPILLYRRSDKNTVFLYNPADLLDGACSVDTVAASMEIHCPDDPSSSHFTDFSSPIEAAGDPSSSYSLAPHQRQKKDSSVIYAFPKSIVYRSGSYISFMWNLTSVSPTEESVQRRRLEVARESLVTFPSLTDVAHPLVGYIIEALQIVLGNTLASKLQFDLISRAWEAKQNSKPWNLLDELCHHILETVTWSLDSTEEPPRSPILTLNQTSSSPTVQAEIHNTIPFASSPNGALAPYVDPSQFNPILITAHKIESQRMQKKASHLIKASRKKRFFTLWSPMQCGLCAVMLHLLRECCRLQENLWSFIEILAFLNRRLAEALGWKEYARYYEVASFNDNYFDKIPTLPRQTDFRSIISSTTLENFFYNACHTDSEKNVLHSNPTYTSNAYSMRPSDFEMGHPPNLVLSLQTLMSANTISHNNTVFPILLPTHMSRLSRHNPLVFSSNVYLSLLECFSAHTFASGEPIPWWERVCRSIKKYQLSLKSIYENLIIGASLPIIQALSIAKNSQDESFHLSAPAAVGLLADTGEDVLRLAQERSIGREYKATLIDDDGVAIRPDFPKTWRDARLEFVQTLFNTAVPVTLPSQSDGTETLYTTLNQLAKRSVCLPLGRGIFTLCTENFNVQDSIPIPPLNIDGRTSDGLPMTYNRDDLSGDHMMWPLFHNGCAAGLRFLPFRANNLQAFSHMDGETVAADTESSDEYAAHKGNTITRHWVVYQTKSAHCAASSAGLLLAAGLLGHLKVLQLTDIFSLLVAPRPQEVWKDATTISVLLGLSASFRGTNYDVVFRCISMHIQSLTPTNEDLEVSLDVQTAAFVSCGLLCQQTPTNSFLVEMFLVEMSRRPSDEHCVDREGYALAAGFGLGLILLGTGSSHGLPLVEDRLIAFMEGSRRDAVPSVRYGLDSFNERCPDSGHFLSRTLLAQNIRESTKCPCTKVYEGSCYNPRVSGPAAIVSLGLMYLRTNNASIAAKLAPPNRSVTLLAFSPSSALLRTTMANLVLWSRIEASQDWLYQRVPSCLLSLSNEKCTFTNLAAAQVRYLQMILGHCIAGAAFALGLRYAGSINREARDVVLKELKGFCNGYIGSTELPISTLQRSTGAFELCITTCAVALGMIMAGTGDLECLSVLQRLHKRLRASYGSHMAVSSSIGLLFLGGGRMTLTNSLSATASLIIAFYPLWPSSPSDNVHHLQALRHLYCLAVVPRLLETVDSISGRLVSVPVRIVLREGKLCQGDFRPSLIHDQSDRTARRWGKISVEQREDGFLVETPCLLPHPDTIERIEVDSPQHYAKTILNDNNAIDDENIVLRVTEKKDEASPSGGSMVNSFYPTTKGSSAITSSRSLASDIRNHFQPQNIHEDKIVSYLKRLCANQEPNLITSFLLIDNIQLLCKTHRRLRHLMSIYSPSISRTLSGHQNTITRSGFNSTAYFSHPLVFFSSDFIHRVQEKLEKRFNPILACLDTLRKPSSNEIQAPSAFPSIDTMSHPLLSYIIGNEPLLNVLGKFMQKSQIQDHLCSRIATKALEQIEIDTDMISSDNTNTNTNNENNTKDNSDSPSLNSGSPKGENLTNNDKHTVLWYWLGSAMYYFGLGYNSNRIHEVLKENLVYLSEGSESRRAAILKINAELMIPLDLLECLIDSYLSCNY